ncbi:MAG: helix-turn-helix domain-containing protein [Christensenellaceae bacterium]|jgi:transcriptional regulator with XRE-family HTH domain
MNHIGNIIHEFRNSLHLTRQELSAEICSEKYLYMIEKGDRTPSTEVMRRLEDRMGVAIFKYYDYLDCAEPIKVCSLIERFYRHRRESNFDAILKDTKEAMHLNDFRNDPWKYEIKINHLMMKVFAENNYKQSIPILIETIEEVKQERAYNISLSALYVLLSTCYQMDRDIDNARRSVALASEAISGKQEMTKYVYITTMVKLNKITMHYLAGEMNEVIEEALDLLKYEEEKRYKGYSDHASFYLAFAYFQIGQEEKGIRWFQKALCMMLISPDAANMQYLSSYEIFDVMMRDKRISKDLVDEFKNEYKLIGL